MSIYGSDNEGLDDFERDDVENLDMEDMYLDDAISVRTNMKKGNK